MGSYYYYLLLVFAWCMHGEADGVLDSPNLQVMEKKKT